MNAHDLHLFKLMVDANLQFEIIATQQISDYVWEITVVWK